MKFLEAKQLIRSAKTMSQSECLIGSSAMIDPLLIYLQAEWAARGIELVPQTLPFNTLTQHLLRDFNNKTKEIFLLLPWDFVAELDWRSGIPDESTKFESLLASAEKFALRLSDRSSTLTFYVPAPIPPVLGTLAQQRELADALAGIAGSLGAVALPSTSFSMSTYLSTGCPFGGAGLGDIASLMARTCLDEPRSACKVLVTDLDNVMWRGVLAEEGLDGVKCGADTEGFKHFIYASFLVRLKNDGILIAAVSRNSPEIVLPMLDSGRIRLRSRDFVAIMASYNAKSAQISELARQLNLGLDSFVFVDDNPVELAEVTERLPMVRAHRFPDSEDLFADFLDQLSRDFPRATQSTNEDRERTELYRRRLEGIVASEVSGGDVSEFLRGLQMELAIRDATKGDTTRALQLINKTNQFNLNGRRLARHELDAMLADGYSLYTATLSDRTGSHGEILACLMDSSGGIHSLVMSCRVFERKVEFAFLSWLLQRDRTPRHLYFSATERNEPFRRFLSDESFTHSIEGHVLIDAETFMRSHQHESELIRILSPHA